MPSDGHPPLTEAEIEVLSLCAGESADWLEVSRAVESAAATRDSPSLALVGIAFVYLLREADHGRGRRASTEPYEVMYDTGTHSFPPRPVDVEATVLRLWRQAADAVAGPVARARLLDLLFVAAGPSAHEDGRAAAHDLMAVAELPRWSELDRALAIARALDITSQLNDRVTALKVAATAATLAAQFLKSEHAGPPFIVMRALVALRPALRPPELESLIDRAIERFSDTNHHVAALGLSIAVATDAHVVAGRRVEQLEVMEAAANCLDGLALASALGRAANFADEHGLDARAHALRRRLQDLDIDDEFVAFEVETSIPTEQVEIEIDAAVGAGADDLAMALRMIGEYGPPGGSPDDLNDYVTAQRAEFALLDIFTPTLFQAGSSIPVFVPANEDDRQRMGVARQRILASEFTGTVLLSPMFDRAVAHHGRPSHEDLAAIWSTELIGTPRGERIARALELFWDGDHDASAHLIVPRLEGIFRDLAAVQGMVVQKTPRPGVYGGAVTLGPVMQHLRVASNDEEWICHIESLLCDPLGLNLRNAIAHGLTAQVRKEHAALLLQVACWLLCVRLQRSSEES